MDRIMRNNDCCSALPWDCVNLRNLAAQPAGSINRLSGNTDFTIGGMPSLSEWL